MRILELGSFGLMVVWWKLLEIVPLGVILTCGSGEPFPCDRMGGLAGHWCLRDVRAVAVVSL